MNRVSMLFAMALTALVTAAPVHAAAIQPFTEAVFETAQAEGRPILVDAHADWCPICHLQAPTLEKLSKDPNYDRLLILRLDFDKQASEKEALNIRSQSTLIAYRGKTETGRSVGVTNASSIAALADVALKSGS